MYLIVGASGFLGRYIVDEILNTTQEKILATFSTNKPSLVSERVEWLKVDVQDRNNIDSLAEKIDGNTKIIYLSAYHHPDKVEENPELAWNINITSLAYAINKFRKAKCFYYSSTDTVYGAGSVNYKFKEIDKTNPVNLYGINKVLAEQITLSAGRNVVRYPFIIGPSLVETKKHFFDKIVEDISDNKSVEMFEDSYRSTLSFKQCAYFLIQLIENFGACPEKIVNIASDEPLSKYEVALKICEKYKLNKDLVKPISIKKSEGIFKAKRAATTVLDNSILKDLLKTGKIGLEF